jgi:hypothetical protein
VTVQVAGIIAEVKCLVDTGLREWTQQRLHFRRRKIWVLLPVLKNYRSDEFKWLPCSLSHETAMWSTCGHCWRMGLPKGWVEKTDNPAGCLRVCRSLAMC